MAAAETDADATTVTPVVMGMVTAGLSNNLVGVVHLLESVSEAEKPQELVEPAVAKPMDLRPKFKPALPPTKPSMLKPIFQSVVVVSWLAAVNDAGSPSDLGLPDDGSAAVQGASAATQSAMLGIFVVALYTGGTRPLVLVLHEPVMSPDKLSDVQKVMTFATSRPKQN